MKRTDFRPNESSSSKLSDKDRKIIQRKTNSLYVGENARYEDYGIEKPSRKFKKVNYTDVTDNRVSDRGIYEIHESGFTAHLIEGNNSRDALKKYKVKYGVNSDIVNITYKHPSGSRH